jgi:hypothetical protein
VSEMPIVDTPPKELTLKYQCFFMVDEIVIICLGRKMLDRDFHSFVSMNEAISAITFLAFVAYRCFL